MRRVWSLGLVWLVSLSAAQAADNVDVAEAQFKKSCGTCHVAEQGALPRQGPNLFAVVGRPAGAVAGFAYSPAFLAGKAGIVWDETTLDRWMTDPQAVIPGAIMPFKQVDPDKRQLILAYLKTRR